MSEPFAFRYDSPRPPEGVEVTQEEAEQLLLKRLEEEPHEPNAFWQLARFYCLTGRQDLALSYLEEMISESDDPELRAAAYLGMGQVMEQAGRYDDAIAIYSRALAHEPSNGPNWYCIHNNLGYSLGHVGRFEESEGYCRRAIQIDPRPANAHKNLGIALEGRGKWVEAVESYIAAIQADAADGRALRHLEILIKTHPELALKIPGLGEKLINCRAAVSHAAQSRSGQPRDEEAT